METWFQSKSSRVLASEVCMRLLRSSNKRPSSVRWSFSRKSDVATTIRFPARSPGKSLSKPFSFTSSSSPSDEWTSPNAVQTGLEAIVIKVTRSSLSFSSLSFSLPVETSNSSSPMNSNDNEPLPFATCVLWGLFHYRTFDGTLFDFTGSCNYKLGGTQSWQVNVQPVGCSSWKKCSKQLAMLFGSVNITAQGRDVIVNGVPLDPTAGTVVSGVTIERHGNYTYLTYSDGVRVKWDEATVIDLTVDISFKGRVTGLCGDYDADAKSSFADAMLRTAMFIDLPF